MYIFFVISFILCVVYVLKVRFSRLYKMVFKFPAASAELPIFGSGFEYLRSPEDLMTLLIKNARSISQVGGAARFYSLNIFYIGLTDASDIACVLKTCLDKDFIYTFLRRFTGNGSAFAPTAIAKERRQALVPSFNPRLLSTFVDDFWEESAKLTETLASHAGNGPFSIEKYLNAFNFGTILKTAKNLQEDQGYSKTDFLHTINKCMTLTNQRIISIWMHPNIVYTLTSSCSELRRCAKFLSHCGDKIRNYRKEELTSYGQSETRKDSNRTEDLREGIFDPLFKSKLNDTAISEEIVILIAATDLTGMSIGFTLMLLGLYPSVQDQVYKELQDVFGDSDRPLIKDDLSKLNYLDMVMKESLRLYPPAPLITRKAMKEVILPSGKIIPAGASICAFIVGLHRNPKYWGPDAEHFDPSRFSPERFDKVHPNAYMPFSYGARNCIGYKYGQMLMKTFLSTLLRKYRIVGETAKGPIPNIRTKFGIFMTAVNNFEIELVNRN